MPKRSTYCWEFTGRSWRTAANDDWETEVYGPTGQERFLGTRLIDGTRHRVYSCPDGVFRAIVDV